MSPNAENRKDARYPLGREFSFRVTRFAAGGADPDPNAWSKFKVSDVSRGGLGAITPSFMPMKAEVEIKMSAHEGDTVEVLVQGVITYCGFQKTQDFKIGIEFSKLSEAARTVVQTLVHSAARGAGSSGNPSS